MKIIIIGCGKVGSKIATQVVAEGHDTVVIDRKKKALDALSSAIDVMCIEGSAVDYNIQEQAGVSTADIVIACTDSDEVNMLTCLLAKRHGAQHTIARVRTPEYFGQISVIQKEFGLSLAINPERSAADTISRVLLFPAAESIETFSRGRIEVVELLIEKNNPLIGLAVKEISSRFKLRTLICAISRGNEAIIPNGDTIMEECDSIFVVGPHSEIQTLVCDIDVFESSARSVLIVGGGRVSYYLAEHLLANNINVKIIDNNEARCKELSEMLPKAIIICADGSDEEVLKEEGVGRADAFLAMTGLDEVNTILALFAKEQGSPKVIAKVTTLSFTDTLKKIGVDSIVSPKEVTASNILRYVRALAASGEDSKLEALCTLVGGRVEALEFNITQDSAYVDIPLRNLSLKPGFLIASITRNGRNIFPGGNDTIEVGDRVIIVTTVLGVKSPEEMLAEV